MPIPTAFDYLFNFVDRFCELTDHHICQTWLGAKLIDWLFEQTA